MQKAFSSCVTALCILQALVVFQSQSVAQTTPALLPLPAAVPAADAKPTDAKPTNGTSPVAPAESVADAPAAVAPVVTVPTVIASASPAVRLSSVNILIVPMELNEGAATAGASPATIDGVAAAGPSQSAAAALRRALVRRGWNDVLMAAPDSGVFRRLVADKVITAASLSAAQNALRQLETAQKGVAANVSTLVPAPAAPPAAITASPASPLIPIAPLVSDNTATSSPPLDKALREAVRLGRALNYRAVVLLGMKRITGPAANAAPADSRATYVLVLADSLRETAQAQVFEESGATAVAMNEAAAGSGLLFLEKEFANWPTPNAGDRDQKVAEYLQGAREQIAAGKPDAARTLVNEALALDNARAETYLVLGDVLLLSNPKEASEAYRKAIGKTGANNGEIWAKVAAVHVKAQEWPRTLEAANNALEAGYDTAALRASMAAAQFGRAILFRNAGQPDNADAAAAEANKHLERAKALAPDDPVIARTHAGYLVAQTEYLQAAQALDPIAGKYPDDIELQELYGTVLLHRANRGDDAFAAWSRVWKAKGTASATFTITPFRRLTQGFDEFVSNKAKEAAALSQSVINGGASREEALPQMQQYLADMERAQYAVKILQAPSKAETRRLSHRVFAADLLVQTLDMHRTFIETGDRNYFNRANDLHRQAMIQINTARLS